MLTELDWMAAVREISKNIAGYSALLTTAVLPLLYHSLLMWCLSLVWKSDVQNHLLVNLNKLFVELLTLSILLGIFFGIVIQGLQLFRSFIKTIWMNHTPPFEGAPNKDGLEVPEGNWEIFERAQSKAICYYKIGTLFIVGEIICFLVLIFLGDILSVDFISVISKYGSTVIEFGSRIVERSAILGDISALIGILPDFSTTVLIFSSPASGFFTFGSQNAWYVFREFPLAWERFTDKARIRDVILFIWPPISVIILGIIAGYIWVYPHL